LIPSDEELLRQVYQHDEEAFQTLLERYAEAIQRHLAHLVGDASAAQDLAQEVFLRVWTCAGQWNASGSCRSWLYRIATNQGFNYLRSRRRSREQPLEVPEDEANEPEGQEGNRMPAWLVDASALGPDALAELAEQSRHLQSLVAALPQDKREVFQLVHEMDMSIRDVADELGIPEGTVKSRLHYARRQLASRWEDYISGG
jgi:RNA polymerase sigma-70 factor (ECF subfamily)